jgi:hypothetical protein
MLYHHIITDILAYIDMPYHHIITDILAYIDIPIATVSVLEGGGK